MVLVYEKGSRLSSNTEWRQPGTNSAKFIIDFRTGKKIPLSPQEIAARRKFLSDSYAKEKGYDRVVNGDPENEIHEHKPREDDFTDYT